VTAFAGRDLACRRGERLVFSGLSFAVTAGGALLLRGPNGSGKSSLLRCMAGLLTPVAGTLTWDRLPTSDDVDAHRVRLRYLGHQDAVKGALTVAENLLMWLSLNGGRDVSAVARALERLGIARLADLPARLLSAGQRRRLALARLLVAPAPLWLLDEPGNALDDDGLARFAELVSQHRAAGGIAVLSSHGDLGVPGEALTLTDFAAPPEPPP
jgi:heme exporter protein A